MGVGRAADEEEVWLHLEPIVVQDEGGGEEETPAPDLAERRALWEAKRRHHARAVPGRFGFDNLVPRSRPELWQDAPHSTLEELRTPEAQGRLAVCQLRSSLGPSRLNAGVATYAHPSGDLHFQRQEMPRAQDTLRGTRPGVGAPRQPNSEAHCSQR